MTVEKKYRLTEEAGKINDVTVHRIQALKQIGRIKPGELGGFVQSEDNLSHEGLCWIEEEAVAFENSRVEGDSIIRGEAAIFGNAVLKDSAEIRGDAEVLNYAVVCENAKVWGNAEIGGRAVVSGRAIIHNHARIMGAANVRGKVIQNGSVTGMARIHGGATIGGSAQIGGIAQIEAGAVIDGTADIRKGIYFGDIPFYMTIGPVQKVNFSLVWITYEFIARQVNCESFSGTLEEFPKWALFNLRVDAYGMIAFFKSHSLFNQINIKP